MKMHPGKPAYSARFGRLDGLVIGVFFSMATWSFAEVPAVADGGFAVPVEVSSGLGWKPMPGEDYRPYEVGSVFVVGSEPGKWPEALKSASAWADRSPSLDENIPDHLFRKIARIEALALSAKDPAVLEQLKKERQSLAMLVGQLRDIQDKNGQDWQLRNTGEQLQSLGKTLALWLADTPADRVQAFKEEMDALRPAGREKIAARYGGEERLQALIALGREYNRLVADLQAAQQDTALPEAERKLAIRKANGALGYFYGYNSEERDFRTALQDPDLAGEFGGASRMDHRSLDVPELVTLAGEDEATKLLVTAYALPVRVGVSSDGRTAALARRLLIQGKLSPSRLPWSLLTWPGNDVDERTAGGLVALFDAIKVRFPAYAEKTTSSDWNRDEALASVAYALAVVGRTDEAQDVLSRAGANASGLPYHARLTQPAAEAIWDMLVRSGQGADTARLWSNLKSLAGPAKRGAELITFAKKQATEAENDSEAARVWQSRVGWSLLAEEKIDEGLAVVMPLMETQPKPSEKAWSDEWGQAASRLLLLGNALPRPELVTQWSAKLTELFTDPANAAWNHSELFDTYAKLQMKGGRESSIEQLLRARLNLKPAPRKRGGDQVDSYAEDDRPVDRKSMTLMLVDVLSRQGKHAEVVDLLAKSPDWGSSDLAQEIDRGGGGTWRPLPLIAAESLHSLGRTGEATAIMEAYLIENSGSDPAYSFYTQMRGAEAEPFLEKLRAADHYEERPLIWLASLRLQAGKIDAAEETIKRAIATDPSDGEQPKNDRMRAYAVLRDIVLKKGDTAQADFLAGVLAAIRRSENADDLVEAGLVGRAISEYSRALDSFSDAYCIQSRLARQLAEENRTSEALEHYKRAFELMPDSFGQVESHCFGCEQAFAGQDAQAIAEKVFLSMAARPYVKPQVFYLLGYLRMEQEKWEEAARYFTLAVEADPEYLNAWIKLSSVLPNTLRPRTERDRVAFQLLALDPAGKHGGSNQSSVRDLPALWKAYAATAATGLAVPEKIYPLGDKAPKTRNRDDEGMSSYNDHQPKTPAERMARHDVLRPLTNLLDQLYQWAMQRQ
jgi:tetratricopeptide (TPR) repeat protein